MQQYSGGGGKMQVSDKVSQNLYQANRINKAKWSSSKTTSQ
jgi:hypothetical protein